MCARVCVRGGRRLEHNSLRELPAAVSSLRALRLLDASVNALVAVPSELACLTRLELLLLARNKIRKVRHRCARAPLR